MLRIDSLNPAVTTFRACPPSLKLTAQKNARRLAATGVEQLSNLSSMTTVKSQVIDDVGMFMAKEATKNYSTTSGKLAEQKAERLLTKV